MEVKHSWSNSRQFDFIFRTGCNKQLWQPCVKCSSLRSGFPSGCCESLKLFQIFRREKNTYSSALENLIKLNIHLKDAAVAINSYLFTFKTFFLPINNVLRGFTINFSSEPYHCVMRQTGRRHSQITTKAWKESVACLLLHRIFRTSLASRPQVTSLVVLSSV